MNLDSELAGKFLIIFFTSGHNECSYSANQVARGHIYVSMLTYVYTHPYTHTHSAICKIRMEIIFFSNIYQHFSMPFPNHYF